MIHRSKFKMFLLSLLFFLGCGTEKLDFEKLITTIENTKDESREALLEEFIARQETFPIVKDSMAYFLYKSFQGDQPYLCGDMCFWDPDSIPMVPIEGTEYYYFTQKFPLDARVEYKFVIEQNFILDHLNPIKESGPMGTNSVLVMPSYTFPKEILINKSNSISTIDTLKFKSWILKNDRDVFVYKANIDKKAEAIVIFHDGLEYLRFANAQHILDNLITDKKIPPVYAVFVNPVNRMTEYWMNDDYIRMIFNELLPRIKKDYNIGANVKVGLGGASLGGLISVYALKKYENKLDFIFSQSGAFQIDNGAIFNTISDLTKISAKLHFTYGSFEKLDSLHIKMANQLEIKNVNFAIEKVNEAHNWGNWRAHLADALEFCLNGKGNTNES